MSGISELRPSSDVNNQGVLDLPWVMPISLSIVLIVISFQNYPLFHLLVELFAIIIGVLLFVIAWQTYQFSANNFLMFLACGYFWLAALDMLHSLVFPGMKILPVNELGMAPQMWIATRYCEALILLTAPLFLTRGVARTPTFLGFGVISAFLSTLVLTGNFPDAFIPGQGLTPFKIYSEYMIIALLAGSLLHLVARRALLTPQVFNLLTVAVVLTMGSELAFTFFVDMYGISNLVGHIFKLFSFWLIFMAVVRSNLQAPYLALIEEVAEHKLAEEKIAASLREKEILVSEIHHRVKNNLQVISSMLSLQVDSENDKGTVEALEESRRRIKVMARIHENLHSAENLSSINARDYLHTVVNDTKESSGIEAHNIAIKLDVDDIVFEVDHAVACGQIASELMSNVLKHAFTNGQRGNVEVSLRRTGEGRIELIVADDGKGLPEGFDPQHTSTLGLKLVHGLTMQLQGDVDIDGSAGTRVQVTFKEQPV